MATALTATLVGVLRDDPFGDERYTRWRVRVFDTTVTCFSRDAVALNRKYFRGDRVRIEGAFDWNEFGDEYSPQMTNCAVDNSDLPDQLKGKFYGTVTHDLEVETDEGGRFIRVKMVGPFRRKRDGEFVTEEGQVMAMILAPAVDSMVKLDEEGATKVCVRGDLDHNPYAIEGEDVPGFYMECEDEVVPDDSRSGEDFWNAKPKGLKNRKAAAPPAKPAKTGKGGGDKDDVPF